MELIDTLPEVIPVDEIEDEPECTPVYEPKPTVYDSSDEEDVDLVGFKQHKMYGSFDETGRESVDDDDDVINHKINQMIIDIVSDAVSELQAECRLESDLSRKTADVVLEILAGALQTSRQASIETRNTESDVENTYIMPSDESTSSSEMWRTRTEDEDRQSILDSKPTPPKFSDPSIGPVDSIEIHHIRQKGIVIRASTEPSIDEHEEIFETTEGLLEPVADHINVSRKSSVTFGTCHVHQIEPVAYLSSGSSLQSEDKFYTDAELKDLIESEAIALTEDAIFLAKQEIFREFNSVSDETIVSIANELVFDVIDSAIRNRLQQYNRKVSRQKYLSKKQSPKPEKGHKLH